MRTGETARDEETTEYSVKLPWTNQTQTRLASRSMDRILVAHNRVMPLCLVCDAGGRSMLLLGTLEGLRLQGQLDTPALQVAAAAHSRST